MREWQVTYYRKIPHFRNLDHDEESNEVNQTDEQRTTFNMTGIIVVYIKALLPSDNLCVPGML